ncbi:MAG: methyl-accepting chemotaxis protein [Peptococcaceae bacterium]|nr:methyl-accepting chemotaxis protein [Peptococcaceae bacterium]
MKISQKIMAGYFLVLLVFVVTGAAGIANMHRMQRSYADLVDRRVYLAGETKAYLMAFEYEALMMRTYFLTGREEWAQEYRDQAQRGEEILERIKGRITSEEEMALFENLSKTVKAYNENYARPMMSIRGRSDLTEQQKLAEITRLTLEQKGTVRGIIHLGEEFVAYQQKLLDEAVQANAGWVVRVTTATTAMFVLALVLGLAAALYIARVIAGPVRQLEQEAKRIADGDLTPRELPASSRDEVGSLVRSFSKMTEKLRTLAERMQNSANLVATYSRELQSSTQNAAEAANATSGRVSQLMETMRNMLDDYRALVEASDRAAARLAGVEETAEKFLRQLEASGAVRTRAGEAVKDLEERLQNVGEIIQFITLIADQASLLAQKAVTEVAYVSEEGNNFIALADEIQKRAREASGAAKGIGGLIENVHRHARQAVASLEEDQAVVMEGYSSAREAAASVKEILSELQALARRVQDVAAATGQLEEYIRGVAKAADEQTALVEGFAVAAGTLNHVAGELQSTVATLKLQ